MYPLLLSSHFNETLKNNLLDRFPKNIQIPNFTKIHPVGAEFFHAKEQKDRRTDRHDEANSRFSQFCQRA